MSDPQMVMITAEEAVKRLGVDAVVFARDQAEVARTLGDAGSALAWADIACAAERVVDAGRGYLYCSPRQFEELKRASAITRKA